MYPPETTCPDDTILPRALRWSKEYRGVKKGKGNLNAFRLFLDELRPDRVWFSFSFDVLLARMLYLRIVC